MVRSLVREGPGHGTIFITGLPCQIRKVTVRLVERRESYEGASLTNSDLLEPKIGMMLCAVMSSRHLQAAQTGACGEEGRNKTASERTEVAVCSLDVLGSHQQQVRRN